MVPFHSTLQDDCYGIRDIILNFYVPVESLGLGISTIMSSSFQLGDTINTAQVRAHYLQMAHEVGCGPSKSHDRMRICVSCNRVENMSYL
jgi:hypothetical protein